MQNLPPSSPFCSDPLKTEDARITFADIEFQASQYFVKGLFDKLQLHSTTNETARKDLWLILMRRYLNLVISPGNFAAGPYRRTERGGSKEVLRNCVLRFRRSSWIRKSIFVLSPKRNLGLYSFERKPSSCRNFLCTIFYVRRPGSYI